MISLSREEEAPSSRTITLNREMGQEIARVARMVSKIMRFSSLQQVMKTSTVGVKSEMIRILLRFRVLRTKYSKDWWSMVGTVTEHVNFLSAENYAMELCNLQMIATSTTMKTNDSAKALRAACRAETVYKIRRTKYIEEKPTERNDNNGVVL